MPEVLDAIKEDTMTPGAEETDRMHAVYSSRTKPERYHRDNPAQRFLLGEVEREVLALLGHHGIALGSCRVLEVGCGSGYWLQKFLEWGASDVIGVDLREAPLRRGDVAGTRRIVASGAAIPLSDASMDLVAQFTMMSSVLDADIRRTIARDMLRVLAPGGSILWYDMRVGNPWNRDVCGVDASELSRLFPDCTIDLRRVTLIPQVARLLAPHSTRVCRWLQKVDAFKVFYLAIIQKEV